MSGIWKCAKASFVRMVQCSFFCCCLCCCFEEAPFSYVRQQRKRARKARAKEEKRQADAQPSPLGHKLPCSVSEVDFCTEENPNGRTKPQLQAPLFAKLPAEIRQLIYQEVLCPRPPGGSGQIHLMRLHKTVGHVACREADYSLSGWEHSCWGTTSLPDGSSEEPTIAAKYTEAVDILYTHNEFNIRQCQTVQWLSMTTLPERLHQIASLTIDTVLLGPFHPPSAIPFERWLWEDHGIYWPPMCKILSQMKGLKKLRILLTLRFSYLIPSSLSGPDHSLIAMLAFLKAVEVKDFSLSLPFELTSSVLEGLGKIPYRIERHKASPRPFPM
ncbi:hypothetical protein K402DRAFT_419279 [Aulographum hederae CBS 113979]|uniref:DUF7730 domain-containing protein n=1 Tax=Aulographum hederae CBS 113979 TaxID=1176131 RepID=A0A6G1H5C7_9PEZI|nr:hypothetical protein K402DRAFT_419279 [Aulographum hederae CBS 113979]